MEPERPIEKLLRAFAKKRRQQAPEAMNLPLPTRQQLQREIARRAAAKAGGGFFTKLFPGWRPRLALATCFAAVVVVAGLFLLPLIRSPKPEKLSAANLEMKKAFPRENVPAAPVPVRQITSHPAVAIAPAVPPEQPATVPADKQRVISSGVLERERTKTASVNRQAVNEIQRPDEVSKDIPAQTNLGMEMAALSAAPPPTAPTGLGATDVPHSFAGGVNVKSEISGQSVPGAAPSRSVDASAPPPPTFAENLTETKEGSVSGTVISQHFYRLNVPANSPHAAAASAAQAPMLASFRVEQNSNQLRFVDSDGSVYTGSVPSPSNYFFRVAGTNRNLNQNVVFTGNFIPLTNTLSRRANARSVGGTISAGGPLSAPTNFLSNARISGQLKIGDQKEIEVNAVPAK